MEQILTILGLNGVLTGILIYLSRAWVGTRLKKSISHEYDIKFEEYKRELEHTNNIEMEKMKLENQNLHFNHSKLQSERADVIKNLYPKINSVHQYIGTFASPLQWAGEESIQKKHERLVKSFVELRDFFEPHRIWLEPTLCDKISSFMTVIVRVTSDITEARERLEKGSDLSDSEYKSYYKQRADGWETVKSDILESKKIIEKEFRLTLGVNTE